MSEWKLHFDDYEPESEGLREALCTLGNGYFATRGACPTSRADRVHYPGTYLAGGYDRLTSEIAGRSVENEDLVNLPNWLPLTYRIEGGPWCRIDESEVLASTQELCLREGLLRRELRLRDEYGRITRWSERRLVSQRDRHLAALAVEITAENWSGNLTIRSGLDGSVANEGVARYAELEGRHLETIEARALDNVLLLRSRMRQSRLEVVEAASTQIYRGNEPVQTDRRCRSKTDWIEEFHDLRLEEGDSIEVEKVVVVCTSRDQAVSEAGSFALQAAREALRFDEILAQHRREWERLWDVCDLELAGDSGALRKLRLHVFHILQTVSHHTVELDAGVPARGLHGEAYRGHVFWDELFVLPFLNLHLPVLARALLRYRYRRLPAARRAAREVGLRGAMYPWQSGSDGREESQSSHLNPRSGRWTADVSHLQRHVGSAIAYNVWQYLQITEDHEFLYSYGAEILLEVARFWGSVATHDRESDRYCIRGVMGPDEYHTSRPGRPDEHRGVDNNAYTNVMAAWVLSRALDVLELLPEYRRDELCREIGLDVAEIEAWDDIRRKLQVCFHGDGIISQFESYDSLEEFDWEHYRQKYGDIQRLDRILEAEGDNANRYKLAKQADVLMLFYLFSADELVLLFEQLGYRFDPQWIPRNVEYYMRRTSHGSTLSRVVGSWVLARSDRPTSWRLFCEALDSDIEDTQGGTTSEGIHLGAMAGTVDLIQRCYLGLDTRANALHLDPCLPSELERLSLKLRYRRQILEIEVTGDELRIRSCPTACSPVTVVYRGHLREIAPGRDYVFRLIPSVKVGAPRCLYLPGGAARASDGTRHTGNYEAQTGIEAHTRDGPRR